MKALQNIPKVLLEVDDLRKNNYVDNQLNEYRNNVRKFIENIGAEVCQLIEKYESKIKYLMQENSQLKKQLSPQVSPIKRQSSPPLTRRSSSRQSPQNTIYNTPTPSKALDLIQTAKSNLFAPFSTSNFQDNLRFSSMLAKYKRSKDDDNQFPVQLINPEPASEENIDKATSRYLVKSSRKKQREEELVHFLEIGKKNMKSTESKFMDSIGINKNKKNEENQVPEDSKEEHSDSENKKSESKMNQSLGEICNSLDTSYISKKARNQKRKKQGQIEDQIRKKLQREEEVAKMVKDRGIKSLLQRLRDNVESSPTRPPETIKTSKLISAGKSKDKSSGSPDSERRPRKNSKVMINPVPVDIVKKSAASKRYSSQELGTPSPERKPQSILKKQSSNILTNSLTGISVIEFDD